MARKPEIFTAKIRRADDGAQDAKYKKKPAAKEAVKAEAKAPAKRRAAAPAKGEEPAKARKSAAAAEKKPTEKKQTEKKPAEKKKAAPKAETTPKAKPAAQADQPKAKRAAEPDKKEKKSAAAQRGMEKAETKRPARARREAPLTRREAKEQEKLRIAAHERRQALSRSGGFGVTLMTLLTVAFDVLGLLLCAVRGETADMQALTLLGIMAPLALITALVLPRFAPVEPLLMALTNFLCGVSVVILYTVSPERGYRQAVFYAAGVAVMLVMAAAVSRLRRWRALTALAMLLGVGALILPLAFGQWNYGAKNWVSLPVIGSFQPSEFVKLSLVLVLAYSFSAHRTIFQMMPALVFAAACLVLLMLQRDLGTALIYYITTLVMFYAACGNVPLTLMGLCGGAGAAVMGYRMFAHVKVRVAMWKNPWSDALDKGYQIIQALLAIGSGGLFGVGLGQGTPDKIPAYYNDFIFAVVCEQLGMVFGVGVIAVYALLIVRSVSVCMRSRRSFDLLLGCGVAAMIGIQTFMIVAGVIKMIPLTGVTMPFLSYGGSSLISCMAMMGILHGVYARAQGELEEDILG